MSSKFSGFDKSAPAQLPNTRSEKQPTSSWDLDMTPFEKLLHEHSENNKQLAENFSKTMTRLVDKLAKEQETQDKTMKQLHEMHQDVAGMMTKVIHYCERMAVALEQFENIAEKKNKDSKETLLFWVFWAVLLLFFFLYFILPKYM